MEMFSNVFFFCGKSSQTNLHSNLSNGTRCWGWIQVKCIMKCREVHPDRPDGTCYIMLHYVCLFLIPPFGISNLTHIFGSWNQHGKVAPRWQKSQWASGSALFRLLDQGDGAVTLDEFLGEFFGWQDINRTWFPWNCDCQECVFVTFINRGETNKRNIIDYLHLFYSILISLHSIFYCILYSIVFYSILCLHNNYFVVHSIYLSINAECHVSFITFWLCGMSPVRC